MAYLTHKLWDISEREYLLKASLNWANGTRFYDILGYSQGQHSFKRNASASKKNEYGHLGSW